MVRNPSGDEGSNRLAEYAALAEVGSQRLCEFRAVAADMPAKDLFEFAVAPNQSLKPFSEASALRIEVFL